MSQQTNAGKWETLPKGWTQKSIEKFWDSLTGDVKHRVTKCMKEMEGKVDDTGAFCASLADKVDPGWRSRRAAFLTREQDETEMELSPKGDRLFSDFAKGRKVNMRALRRELEEAAERAGYPSQSSQIADLMIKGVIPGLGSGGVVRRVARRYMMSLNKYNAPEMLSALMKALQVAGLEETVDELRRMRIPQIINDAWMHREKTAMGLTSWGKTMKEASGLRSLSVIMDPMRPYVTDYRKFVEVIDHWFSFNIMDALVNYGRADVSQDSIYDMEDVLYGAQVEEGSYSDNIDVNITITTPIRSIVKYILDSSKHLVTDKRGFVDTLTALISSSRKFQSMMKMEIADYFSHTSAWGEVAMEDVPQLTRPGGFSITKVNGNPKIIVRVGSQTCVCHVSGNVLVEAGNP